MPEDEPLSETVFHQLLDLIRFHRQHRRQMIDAKGITLRELSVIGFVGEHGAVKISDIQDFIHHSPSTTSTLVAKLEEVGYVTRQRSKTDRRVVNVTLTPAGESLLEATPLSGMPLLRRNLERLSAERLTEMSSVLEEIRALMQSNQPL